MSIAIRGVRPSPEEVAEVLADPGAIEAIIDRYLASPAFGETIKDMHSEFYRVRTDIAQQYPALGILEGTDLQLIHTASADEPLRLVEDIVTRDLPYTEVVTADWVVSDAVLAKMFGLPFDPQGTALQHTWWTDGRPPSGVLSSSEFYRRYPSNGNNFHRGRAAVTADIFLCDDIGARETTLTIENAPPSTAVDQVVDTLAEPGCAGCHAALEPLAAFFWGYIPVVPPGPIVRYMRVDCDVPAYDEQENLPPGTGFAEDLCYPLRFFTPSFEDLRSDYGLPQPAVYGVPGQRMDDLGRLLAADPRFGQCAAKRFTSWFTQTPLAELDPALVGRLSERFRSTGFNARDLVRSILLSDQFRQQTRPNAADPSVGLLAVRPEQFASQIEALTGFRWLGDHRNAECEDDDACWGVVDLARSDLFGFRSLGGGVDGLQQIDAVHTPTPTRQLVLERFATEAAAHVVEHDFGTPGKARLLRLIAPGDEDEGHVRAQIADLWLRILTRVVDPQDPEVDAAYALYAAARVHRDSGSAWELVLVALFTDPELVLY